MPRVALVTCVGLVDGDADDRVLADACRAAGLDARIVAWNAPDIGWADFDAVVLRSTWDYTDDRDAFLAWAGAVHHLYNPLAVIAPNTDKAYLVALADAGLPVVPTTLLAPGAPVTLPPSGEVVLKPTVGAGSRGAGRFDLSDDAAHKEALEHAAALHDAGRTVMVQPYQAAVDTDGETAMIFIDGCLSHAVSKGAMLQPQARFRVDDTSLYIEERIEARVPSPAETEVAERVMAHLGHSSPMDLLYARIDLLPGPAGPVVVEVELTEPSLFLTYGEGAATRLARAICDRIGSPA